MVATAYRYEIFVAKPRPITSDMLDVQIPFSAITELGCQQKQWF